MSEDTTNPNAETLVIEVRLPGKETWIAQTMNTNGEHRIAQCHVDQGDKVISEFEKIYGVGNVRTVAAIGYQPDPAAEQMRAQIQEMHIQPGRQLGATGGRVSRVGSVNTTVLATFLVEGLADEPAEIGFAINIQDHRVAVHPITADGDIEQAPIFEADGNDPTIGVLRNANGLITNFVVGHFNDFINRMFELSAARRDGGDVPRCS